MVRRARIALALLGAVAAQPAAACRLALALAMDVSSSVDAAEDALQRGGLAAALVALAAGMAGGWAVSTYVMETGFTPIWTNALAIVLGGVVTTLLAGLAFALRPLSAKPARVLRARE